MPKEIGDKIVWLFLLLPGFLSMSLVSLIGDLGELTEFQTTFYSLILTLVDLAVAIPLCWGILRLVGRFKPAWSRPDLRNFVFCFAAVGASLFVGVILGLAAEQDRFFTTLRALPITDTLNKRSSARPLAFLLFQNTTGRLKKEGDARPQGKQTEAFASVEMKSGKRYEGWPEFYGTGNKPSEIYLSPACESGEEKMGKEDGLRPIKGPGVILYEAEIASIKLLDRAESPCYAHWYGRSQSHTDSPSKTFMFSFEYEAKSCSENSADFRRAYQLGRAELEALRNLGKGLAACGAAEIEIRGFASSSRFEGCTNSDSNELNRRLSNYRAAAAKAAIEDGSLRNSRVNIIAQEWHSFDQMRMAQAFADLDSKSNAVIPFRATLTRRVEVTVSNAGECGTIAPGK